MHGMLACISIDSTESQCEPQKKELIQESDIANPLPIQCWLFYNGFSLKVFFEVDVRLLNIRISFLCLIR